MTAGARSRPGRLLPGWRQVLAVVAHPDDETFGLGAIVDSLAAGGAAVHVLCFTRGEASTLNENHAELSQARDRELRQAAAELGAATVTLLDYPDGHLAEEPAGELPGLVTRLAARLGAEGLLVFDDTGITGHPDHQAATLAALLAAPPACPCWPGRCQTPSLTGCGPRPARPSRDSHPAGSTCASGWTGPGSAAPPCCTPARSPRPLSCGGGCNCRATAST